MFISSRNQVNVLRTMKIKQIFDVTAFGADLNKSCVKYLIAAMEGMDVSFRSIRDVPSEVIYSFVKKKFLEYKWTPSTSWDQPWRPRHRRGACAGSRRSVVQPIAARIWEIQRHLQFVNQSRAMAAR
jgi:hypothetical protein